MEPVGNNGETTRWRAREHGITGSAENENTGQA